MSQKTPVKKPATARNERSFRENIELECLAMADYALANGKEVAPDLIAPLADLQDDTAEKKPSTATLADIHVKLAQAIAPVRPATLVFFDDERKHKTLFEFLGPITLIQRLMVIGVLSLIGLIATSLSTYVDGDPSRFSLFHNQGISLLVNQMFLLFAAGIGASFSNLYLANQYVVKGIFDPSYESSYWMRFTLGLLAGIIIATLVPIEGSPGEVANLASAGGAAADSTGTTSGGGPGALGGFGKPLLALLGGFSAQFVFTTLNKLVNTATQFITGDAEAALASREAAMQASVGKQKVENRLQLLSKISTFKSKLDAGGDLKDLQAELNKIQQDLIVPGSVKPSDGNDGDDA